MSIATLKRKSQVLYGKSHSKDGQFSLNGVLRLPTQNLGRNVTRTPFRGPYPMGHGCGSTCKVGGRMARVCGSGYPQIISNSGSCVTTQTEIKRSTMNMLGLIQTKYVGILHGTYPNTHVYRVEKETHVTTVANKTLHCATATATANANEPYIITPSNCAPYTKDVNVLTSSQYAKIHQCSEKTSLPYKGLNSCA
jgi:hypothetical protein